MFILPSAHSKSANYEFDALLDGTQVTIGMNWNTRANFWFMSYKDSRGNELYGIKVVPYWNLLKNHRAFSAISGALVAMPTTAFSDPVITYENWQKTWVLGWLEESELALWETRYGLR